MRVGESPNFYVPLSVAELPTQDYWQIPGVTILGRLNPGASIAQAQSGLDPFWQEVAKTSTLPHIERDECFTLLEVAADPKHLGAEIGFLSILHTWGQTLQPHPHIHCVVPGGGLSPDQQRWLSTPVNFFLPVLVLSRVFRGKFVVGLRRAFRAKQLAFYGECLPLANEPSFTKFLDALVEQDWVVYAKPPFGGPEHVLHYLARYTHRVAISNHRILAVNQSQVLFRWKDYAHHDKQRTLSLTCEEFLRRFLQHVLPKGFPRIRYFGWLANRRRKKLLPLCRDLLPPLAQQTSAQPEPALWLCPRCHRPMAVLERLTASQLLHTEGRSDRIFDSS